MRKREIEDFLAERPKKEAAERLAVVQEAALWLGTPYHQNGDVKGAGVDCGMLLIRVFADLKLIPKFDPRPYPIQWAFNQRAERYLEIVQRFATEFPGPPLPGDVALFKVGHCWAHGGIVTLWPDIIHANPPGDCREDNMERTLGWSRRVPRFFSIWTSES
jgi:cell wall-associated NlpC family hydrolase